MSKPDEALSFFPLFTDNVSPMKHFNSCLAVKLGLCKKIYPVHQRQSWKISWFYHSEKQIEEINMLFLVFMLKAFKADILRIIFKNTIPFFKLCTIKGISP